MPFGRQRKMYHIRDTRSRYYSEAYFILRDGADFDHVCENDLAAEADMILRERFCGLGKKRTAFWNLRSVTFALGTLVGAALMWIIL